jgi:TrmH family RNA methyltransferase
MISSTHNPKIRYLQKLEKRAFRKREKSMRIEGVRLLEEALDAGVSPAFALTCAALQTTDRARALRLRLEEAGVPILETTASLLREAAGTVNPQGFVAAVPIPTLPLPESPSLVLALDEVRDPGNVGTMLRTAAAAGVDMVLVSPGSADPFAPKVMRAAMGAQFRLPILREPTTFLSGLRGPDGAPLRIRAADAEGETDYLDCDWGLPSAILIGGEAEGLSQNSDALSPEGLRITMPGGMESLNAAAAAAVMVFEALRQRRA